jgi:hypothetical protein
MLEPEAGAAPAGDNGLEIRQWIVADDSHRLGSAIVGFDSGWSEPPPQLDALAANGIRMARILRRDLPALHDAVGGSTLDQTWWHGQVTEWRPIHRRALGTSTRGVAIDGQARRYGGGAFELTLRAWTTQTEDGPRLILELVPYFARTLAPTVAPIRPDRAPRGEPVDSLAITFALEAGYAYLITCESPSVRWQAAASDGEASPATDISDAGEVRGSVGPQGAFGPDIAGPVTLGELLFRGEAEGAARGVLILIPRLPASLFPDELIPRYKGEGEALSSLGTSPSGAPIP